MILGVLLAVLGLPATVQAFSVNDFVLSNDAGLTPLAYFAFTPITNNGDQSNIDLGLAVSFGNIDGTNRMFFEFVNQSTNPNHLSAIKEVYFETTLLSGTNAYNEGTAPGVAFSVGSSGGGNAGFPFTINHALDGKADPPPSSTGVNPGESLLLGYALIGSDPGATANEAYNTLIQGDWGIGLHLIATDNGAESEKYIASYLPDGPDSNTPVPEPATVVLLGIGASFLLARMRLES